MQKISRRKFLETTIVGGVGITALSTLAKEENSKGGVMTEKKNSSPWTDGCHGAVSLSFDDGSQSKLVIVIPILKEYNLLPRCLMNF